MNLGERIKQLRAEKNLTQPQLAEAVGIEQSYLSKLENDKSIPSADIFSLMLKGLNISAAEFLHGIDKEWINKQLRHIPDVAMHLSEQTSIKIHSVKQWLYISAVLCILGLTLAVAGYRELIFSNMIYQYESLGVTKPDEPKELFWDERILSVYLVKSVWRTSEQHNQIKIFESERRDKKFHLHDSYFGDSYIDKVEGGFRMYKLTGERKAERIGNRWLMLAGVFLFFCGVFGFITEYRLRRLRV